MRLRNVADDAEHFIVAKAGIESRFNDEVGSLVGWITGSIKGVVKTAAVAWREHKTILESGDDASSSRAGEGAEATPANRFDRRLRSRLRE